MLAELDLAEYQEEIRRTVCSRCVERPPGGPPCKPLGKNCGVEMHLAELVNSIHQVHSSWIEPYLDHNRKAICEKCAFLNSRICPCPMDYLAMLIVEAVEAVDARHEAEHKNRVNNIIDQGPEPDLEAVQTVSAESKEPGPAATDPPNLVKRH